MATDERQDAVKDLLKSNPKLAILAMEILGPPLGLREPENSGDVG